jgi:1-acyl-sn-glycerol-3-phosphate acyltransferase
MKKIAVFILCNLFGWKLYNQFPPDLKKYIIIVAPHTSWFDFPLGILAKTAYGIKANYIAKHTLFKPPYGFIFKALGGTPVDRSKSTNMVEAIIDIFNKKENFILALSPEGTRKKLDKWKTGFYFVAKGAKVPIVMVGFDFATKSVSVADPFYTTDNMKSDYKHFHNFYKNIQGKYPELFEPNFHENV